eukprot:CAMPEP_0119280400 /NCGR_PEP_ID=MMETSP1329-20130426/22564_1 /TAXON_ID=114041 /ORGANISM="Genus nov. species nov., Strain RCC1024" /LENGTH=394 /DNA_ID=CAMNT_0007280985 /DNA_START=214 /DNA_END=1394 /DNA_ORIENTATION=+
MNDDLSAPLAPDAEDAAPAEVVTEEPQAYRPRRRSSMDDDALYAQLRRRRKRGGVAVKALLGVVGGLVLFIGLPATVYGLATTGASPVAFLRPVAGVFAGVSLPIAGLGIWKHLDNYYQPVLQVYVVRILWMVPVYAVCSFAELNLWLAAEDNEEFGKYATIPAAVRECYESYTVLNFFYFMVTFLEVHYGEPAQRVLEKGLGDEAAVAHPCPPYRCLCAPWRLDSPEFLGQCRYGVLLYATVMPLCALLEIVGAFVGDLGRGPAAQLDNWAYAVAFSCSNHAIYCLGLFFYASHDLLMPCHPHSKFIAVKGLVFGTFFQDLGIELVFWLKPALATHFGGTEDEREAALGALKATLMCVEMILFALLHAVAFPQHQYPKVTTTDDDANPSARWL